MNREAGRPGPAASPSQRQGTQAARLASRIIMPVAPGGERAPGPAGTRPRAWSIEGGPFVAAVA